MEAFKTLTSHILILLFVSASVDLFAQFSDDFSDRDLQNAPTWEGHVQDFVINEDLQLRLNASGSGISYITAPSRVYDQATWELFFKFDFNPSSQNYSKVYLTVDGSDLSNPINGYFVMIGGSSDDISLYKVEAGISTKIIDGEDGRLNSTSVAGKIKVMRDNAGKWELLTAVNESSEYLKEGEAVDNRQITALYFGIYCEYTSTRSDKFYFDDIEIIGQPHVDTIPPALLSIKVVSSHQIEATFSEPLSPATITKFELFEVKPEIGHPNKIVTNENPAQLTLYFKKAIAPGTNYLFTAQNLADVAQNVAASLSLAFLYDIPVQAVFRDVVINELMPDPVPVVGLPEAEFIEIFNLSNKTLDLTGWTLSDATSSGKLGAGEISPQEYIILCAPTDSLAFSKYGRVITVSRFPSLNNDSDEVYLRNALNDDIDHIHYTKSWYKSSMRSEGGYTLEMIDHSNPCSTEDNWRVSEHHDGGTPGSANSIQGSKPDNKGPEITSVFPTPDSVLVTFNEVLNPASVEDAQYFLNDQPIDVEAYLESKGTVVVIKLATSLEAQLKYTLTARFIKDCNGNFMESEANIHSFALPQPADSVDVVINEVLFNPNTGGADFVEIYNNSDKYIDLRNWKLANIAVEKETGKALIANRKDVSDHHYLFAPKQLLVLTEDPADIHKNYPGSTGSEMIRLSGLPSYPDDAGSVVLLDQRNRVIDRFDYHEDFHSPIISEPDGVSLERVAYNSPTQDPNNWTSASSTAGFATPGLLNSQSRTMSESKGKITVQPKVIIPDNDGSRDFATIQYMFKNNSYVGNVYVFDADGNRVSTIAENQSFATEGFFSWMGTKDDGGKLRLGVYMIFVEVFDFDGTVEVFKEAVVIGSNF